jgi:hypothetical protein
VLYGTRLTAEITDSLVARQRLNADSTQAKPLDGASRFSLAPILDGSVTLAPRQRLFPGEPHRPVIGIAANYEVLTLRFLQFQPP